MTAQPLQSVETYARMLGSTREELRIIEQDLDDAMWAARKHGHSLREIAKATGGLYTNQTVSNRTR